MTDGPAKTELRQLLDRRAATVAAMDQVDAGIRDLTAEIAELEALVPYYDGSEEDACMAP